MNWFAITLNFWMTFVIIFPGALGYWVARVRIGYDKEIIRASRVHQEN